MEGAPSKDRSRDDNDEVIAEIPVYWNSNPENFWLFQFPLRPHYLPYDQSRLASVRVRPRQFHVEMQFKMDTQPTYFDENATADPDRDVKTVSLNSAVVAQKTNYAIGIYRHGELHLTPVTAILQMRPFFPHIDAQAKSKAPTTDDGLPTTQLQEQQNANPVQRLQIKFRQKKGL